MCCTCVSIPFFKIISLKNIYLSEFYNDFSRSAAALNKITACGRNVVTYFKLNKFYLLVLDVAKSGEEFYRLWTGQRVDPTKIPGHMEEGLAIRRSYAETLQSYRLRKQFGKVLFELMVSIKFEYYVLKLLITSTTT